MATKTSMTHPLEIDELACGPGVVGMTLCPGKRAQSYFGGHWQRNLADDMRVVADWDATAVVTLMEGFELDQLGVGNLGNVAEAFELDWHHLPIPDMQVPDARFERRWTSKPSAWPATTAATATPRRPSRGRSAVPGRGLRAFRNAWIRRLDVLDALLDVAGRLIGLRGGQGNGSIRVTEGVVL